MKKMSENKIKAFRLGMALNNIGLAVDDETYKRIKPYLDELEKGIIELFEGENDGSKGILGKSVEN